MQPIPSRCKRHAKTLLLPVFLRCLTTSRQSPPISCCNYGTPKERARRRRRAREEEELGQEEKDEGQEEDEEEEEEEEETLGHDGISPSRCSTLGDRLACNA
jgi:hypothetical protein